MTAPDPILAAAIGFSVPFIVVFLLSRSGRRALAWGVIGLIVLLAGAVYLKARAGDGDDGTVAALLFVYAFPALTGAAFGALAGDALRRWRK